MYVLVRGQAQLDGANFYNLTQWEYVEIVQANVTAYAERLNFSARDWHKVESCARSWKHVLGGEGGDHDEEAVAEVGANDSDVDENSGVVALGSRGVTLKPRRQIQLEPSTPSSSSSSSAPSAKARPRGSVAISMMPPQKPSTVPPSEAPPLPVTLLRGREVVPPTDEAPPPEAPPPSPPPHQHLEAVAARRAAAAALRRPKPPDEPPRPEMLGGRNVTRAHAELGGSTGMCPQCHVPRSTCFREGDWACALCGQHNYPSKHVCTNFRCKARKGAAVESAPVPEMLGGRHVTSSSPTSWCDSCRRPRTECWKPNDWECPYCKNHNYARKQVSQQRVCVAG